MFKPILIGVFITLVAFNASYASQAELGEAYGAYQEAAAAGDLDGATEHGERAFSLGRDLFGDDNRNTGLLGFNYGVALMEAGYSARAVEPLSIASSALGGSAGNQDYFDASLEYGRALSRSGGMDAAETQLSALLAEVQSSYGANSYQAGLVHLELAELAPVQGAHSDVTQVGESGLVTSAPTAEQRQHLNAAGGILSARGDSIVERNRITLLEAAFAMADQPDAGPEIELRSVIDTLASHHFITDRTVLAHITWAQRHRASWSDEQLETELQRAVAFADFRVEGNVIPLVRQFARYTRSAYAHRRSGNVFYSFSVDETGQSVDFELLSGENVSYFEDSSAQAVAQFIHLPAREGGQAVPTTGLLGVFEFQMEVRAVSRTN